MLRIRPMFGRCVLLMSAFALATAGTQAARAASIGWERHGAFEACLENQLNDWINAKATLVINEDPAAGDLDDIDVAMWAVTVLQGCETQAGHGNQSSEHRFSRHMAHWREHIHTVAQVVRQRVGSD